MYERATIAKLDAAEGQLQAALYLMLRDFPPEPVHTLIAAVRGILYGHSTKYPNAFLENWDKSVLAKIVGPEPRKIREYQNHVANFLKHADRDPDGVLSGVDLKGLNEIEIQVCIKALGMAKEKLSEPLVWATIYFSIFDGGVLPFSAEVISMLEKGAASLGAASPLKFDNSQWRQALIRLIESKQ